MGAKFSVDAGPLKDAVSFAKAALGGGKKMAEQVIRVDFGDGTVALTASDGNLVAAAGVLAKVEGSGHQPFAVIGKRLVGLTSRAKAERFSFDVDDENVEIKAEGGKTDLVVNFERYDADLLDFAVRAQKSLGGTPPGPQEMDVPRDVLVDALEVAGASTAQVSGHAAVGHVEFRDGRMLASDGAKVTGVRSAHFHKGAKLKVPVPVLSKVLSAVKALPRQSALHPHEERAHYFLLSENRLLAIRRVDAKFPAAEVALDKRDGAGDRVVVAREDLLAALDDVALGLPVDQVQVNLAVSGDRLYVDTENSVGRKSTRSLEVQRAGSGRVAFPVSIDRMRSTLGSMKSANVELLPFPSMEMLTVVDSSEKREVVALLPMRGRGQQAPAEEEGEAAAEAPGKKFTTSGGEEVEL